MRRRTAVTVESKPGDDTPVAAVAPDRRGSPVRWRPIPATLFLSVIGMTAYAAYERLGTTANADSVEFTQNLAGGFLAIGRTEDQPGFLLLSALDREVVEVSAVQAISRIAGTHTVVDIRTPRGTTNIRLRDAEAVLVSEDGAVTRHHVGWTLAEFNALRAAADCSHEATRKKHRCGAPFAELHDYVESKQISNVPVVLRNFLHRHGGKQDERMPASGRLGG